MRPSIHNRSQIKLKKRQWINILIFAISVMFLLALLAGQRFTPPTSEPNTLSQTTTQPVQKHHSTISTFLAKIDFGSIQLIKEGKVWKSKGDVKRQIDFDLLAKNWEALARRQPEKMPAQLAGNAKIVLLYFSNIEKPLVAKIYHTPQDLKIAFSEQDIVFSVPSDQINQYLPN